MNNLNIAKFCNSILTKGRNNEEDEGYVDLNNYVFKFDYLMKKHLKLCTDNCLNENEKKEINNFLTDIRKQSKIDVYLEEKKVEFENVKRKLNLNSVISSTSSVGCLKKNTSKIDCIEIDEVESKSNKNEPIQNLSTTSATEIQHNISESKMIDDKLIEKSNEFFKEFLLLLNKNDNNVKENLNLFIIELLNHVKSNDLIKLVFQNFIEHINTKKTDINIEIYDVNVIYLSEIFINLNETNSNLLSYTKLNSILRFLFSNYLISINNNLVFTLSKKLLNMCISLYKCFKLQFIEYCFIEWIKQFIIDYNSSNIEVLLKLIKDLFNEDDLIQIINFFMYQNFNHNWSENVYVTINTCLEKLSKLNLNEISLLINKMKSDCKLYKKSLPFAKLLLNLIDKYKNEICLNQKNQNDQQLPNENKIKEEKRFNNNEDSIKENIMIIIEENQTLMKRKLINMMN